MVGFRSSVCCYDCWLVITGELHVEIFSSASHSNGGQKENQKLDESIVPTSDVEDDIVYTSDDDFQPPLPLRRRQINDRVVNRVSYRVPPKSANLRTTRVLILASAFQLKRVTQARKETVLVPASPGISEAPDTPEPVTFSTPRTSLKNLHIEGKSCAVLTWPGSSDLNAIEAHFL